METDTETILAEIEPTIALQLLEIKQKQYFGLRADTDSDGWADSDDHFDNESSQWLDTDGDGYGDEF